MAPTGGSAGVGPKAKAGLALKEASAHGDIQRVAILLQSSTAAINEADEVSSVIKC